ncbi:MAG: c-type cytochrome [Pseudomonadota bacterium]
MDITMDKKSKWSLVIVLVSMIVAVGGFIAWYKFFREVDQAPFATAEERFMYGSIGGENEAGIPYWIFVVLPRMFPEYLPGQGGYASLGIAWEEGKELPVGFTKKVVGFPRVSNTCAVCHTTSYRVSTDADPVFVAAGPGHTSNVQGFFSFLRDVANDPRFNADNLLSEIKLVTDLSLLDQVLYRFIIIPFTKKALLERNFDWMERDDMAPWGHGRDDAMNLTKYFMLEMEEDGSYGPSDFPSIWNLQKYKPKEGMRMNWDGATYDAYSVLTDSALGIVAEPQDDFVAQMEWLLDYLSKLQAPKYPFPINAALATAGETVFKNNCATCHASEHTGKRIHLDDIGTDPNRIASWSTDAAKAANRTATELGVDRRGMVEDEALDGYIAVHLDGIWLRAPYLHNGSIPNLRELLSSVEDRTAVFYRGYDIYDSVNVGFEFQGREAERVGSRFEVSRRGNGNQGHEFGITLPESEKAALIEYLKTL